MVLFWFALSEYVFSDYELWKLGTVPPFHSVCRMSASSTRRTVNIEKKSEILLLHIDIIHIEISVTFHNERIERFLYPIFWKSRILQDWVLLIHDDFCELHYPSFREIHLRPTFPFWIPELFSKISAPETHSPSWNLAPTDLFIICASPSTTHALMSKEKSMSRVVWFSLENAQNTWWIMSAVRPRITRGRQRLWNGICTYYDTYVYPFPYLSFFFFPPLIWIPKCTFSFNFSQLAHLIMSLFDVVKGGHHVAPLRPNFLPTWSSATLFPITHSDALPFPLSFSFCCPPDFIEYLSPPSPSRCKIQRDRRKNLGIRHSESSLHWSILWYSCRSLDQFQPFRLMIWD